MGKKVRGLGWIEKQSAVGLLADFFCRKQADEEKQREEREEEEEKDLRDSDRGTGDTGKAEQTGDESDHEKDE
jgi:hypothetical protein